MKHLTSSKENGMSYNIMNSVSKNLCYLLWKDGVEKTQWTTIVSSWADCDKKRAHQLLTSSSAKLSDSELTFICRIHGLSQEDFFYSDYLEKDSEVNILKENLIWMLNTLSYGKKKELAEKINKQPITISRWIKGRQTPSETTIKKLREIFSIPSNIDLKSTPLFLYPYPTIEAEQKTWLHSRIDELPANELRNLFPALQKLLSPDSKE